MRRTLQIMACKSALWSTGGVAVAGCLGDDGLALGDPLPLPGTTGSITTGAHAARRRFDESGSTAVYREEAGGFMSPPDFPTESCSTFTQDCAPGYKCTLIAEWEYGWYDVTGCVPIAPDPADLGEPCEMQEHARSGLDNCGLQALCYEVDPETLTGTCAALCAGSVSQPVCPEDHSCSIGSEVFAVCFPQCDPIVQDCPAGEACYGAHQSFMCAPDASGDAGTFGDPCEFINACDPGYECLNAVGVPGCSGSQGCCSPHCALSDPDPPCVDPQECVPWFEEGAAPPEYQDVGVCFIAT